jgi:hypothetical protein
MSVSAEVSDAEPKPDRFTGIFVVYLMAVIGVIAGLGELAYADRNAITFPAELLIALGALIFLVGSLAAALLTRRWRRALSVALAPPVAYGIVQVLVWAGVTPTTIRFQLTKSGYERQVAEAIERGEERPLIMVFPWGELGGPAATNVFGTLIYDETDEIGKPSDQRSDAWRSRKEMQAGQPLHPFASWTLYQRSKRHLQHLDGHFYVATEYY